jgi:hypothetical protein
MKNLSQRSLAEWQARKGEEFRFQCDTRRFEARRNEPVIEDREVRIHGWLWVQKCSEKFEKLYELLDSLDDLARTAQWDTKQEPENPPSQNDLFPESAAGEAGGADEASGPVTAQVQDPAETTTRVELLERQIEARIRQLEEECEEAKAQDKTHLGAHYWEQQAEEAWAARRAAKTVQKLGPVETLLDLIYAEKFTWAGKRIQQLFAACGQDGAPADDPRVHELWKLIRQERADVQEEQRLYEIDRERKTTEPLSADEPVMQPVHKFWLDMIHQESAFDRQIASKLRLLMKLQDAAAEEAVSEDERPDVLEPAPLADEPGGPEAPPPATNVTSGDASIKNTETNPKSGATPYESEDSAQPGEAESEPRGPRNSPPESSDEPGDGQQ